MSNAPAPTENLSIFNPANFGGEAADLAFPTAQGTETFPNGVYWGDGTFQNSSAAIGTGVQNPMTGNVNANTYTITNLASPSNPTDAVTLTYLQSYALTNPLSSSLDVGGNQVIDMADPTANSHAVNLQYADANYLTITDAASTYLTIADAALTYLTDADAQSTYLTISAANTSYAKLNSPALTGAPTAPTQASTDNSTKIATTAFVQQYSGANYLTITDAASTYETIANAALLAPLSSPALTGSPTAPTQASSDNSTKIATTAFVQSHIPTTIPFAPYSFSWTAENWQNGVPANLTLYGPAIQWPTGSNPNANNASTNDMDSYFVMRVTATNSWNIRQISTPSYGGYNNFGCASGIVYVFPRRWGSMSWCGYNNATSTCKYLQNGGGYSGTTGQEGASVSEKSRGLYTTTGLVSNEGEIQNNYSSMFNSFGSGGQPQWQFVSQSPYSAGNTSQYGIRAVLNVEILSMTQNCPPLTIIAGANSQAPSGGSFNGNDFLDVS